MDVDRLGSKLIPRSLASKRWKKQPSKESFGSTASSEDAPRGRSQQSREPFYGDSPTDYNGSPILSRSTTDETLGGGEDEDDSVSPLADAYSEEISPTRPAVPSTHPSQIGHLTTSSPIIQADHAPQVHYPDELASDGPGNLLRSQTYSVSVSSDSSAPLHLSGAKTGLQPPASLNPKRSKSPAGRFKDVFKGRRNASSASSLGSEEPDKADKSDFATAGSTVSLTSSDSRGTITSNASLPDQPAVPSSDANGNGEVGSPEQPRLRRTRTPSRITIPKAPQTPPPAEPNAPVIVNTPPTPTDHTGKGKQGKQAKDSTPPPSESSSNRNITVSPSGTMISHRRARSGSATSIGPSKLSNFTLAPLTPTPENAVPPTPGGSFFSSMLSAAQNAANTLSNTVSTTNIGIGAKPKTPVPDQSTQVERTVEVETPATSSPEEESMGEPAVKTLGQGDLSLSQLGIQESKSITSTPQAAKFPEHIMDNRTRSESAPDAPAALNTSTIADDSSTGRPRSLYDSGDRSPPSSLYEGKTGLQRSASIRSAIERRRKRGSTGGTAATSGTATTIGAAIAAANASVAHPNAAGSVPKLTGFAVASKKRNRDFHSLFKSVPDDDYLIEDYSCALQREILAHGRLYVSEGHLCFSSNILGWVTTLVMSFDEIVSVEKRSTALVFKNGLMISTLHAKHIFASFTSRDSTYDLIVNIWKLGHPTLRSSLNGVSIDETGGDKTEKVDALEAADDHSGSGSEVGDGDSEDEDDEDVYDEDEEDENIHETTRSPDATPPDTDLERGVPRKASGAVAINGNSEKPRDGTSSPAGGSDFPGPSTHGPTDCGDVATHFERALADEVIPAPLGKVYNLIFGPASVNFMSKWLTGDQKCTDLQMDDKIGLTQDNKSRLYTYTKPLYAPIGPKQTKCIVTESIEGFDLEKAVNVIVNTQTPDVPSGNVFSVKTKYCLHWAENNATRVIVNCTIEWTGKSWLKGPIEKGANDGQIQYCKDLFTSVKTSISSRPRAGPAANGTTGKGKKKRNKKSLEASGETISGTAELATKKTQDWGLLQPLHGILGPIVDIIKPILTGNVVYGLLVGLLVASWFGFGFTPRQPGSGFSAGIGFPTHSQRLLAYEEVWRHEESDLWDWLEERVGLHRMNDGALPIRTRVAEPRSVEEKLREDRMNEREVEEAIKVTEEKLQVLKEVHERKKILGASGRQYSKPTTRPQSA